MDPAEEYFLVVAEIVRDSAAMNDAALAVDFDEARFRAQVIGTKADAAGLPIWSGCTAAHRSTKRFASASDAA